MYPIKRIHAALACAGLCVGMTACALEDPALLESQDPALLDEGAMEGQAAPVQPSQAPSFTVTTPADKGVELFDPVSLFARHSGRALDVYGASTANGAQIIQWPWHGGDNQRWRLSPVLP
jgi:hypothetical protein